MLKEQGTPVEENNRGQMSTTGRVRQKLMSDPYARLIAGCQCLDAEKIGTCWHGLDVSRMI